MKTKLGSAAARNVNLEPEQNDLMTGSDLQVPSGSRSSVKAAAWDPLAASEKTLHCAGDEGVGRRKHLAMVTAGVATPGSDRKNARNDKLFNMLNTKRFHTHLRRR